MKYNQIDILRAALPATLLLTLGISAAPEVTAQDAEEETVLEEVVITGSRIRQDPLEQRLPVLTLGEEDYRATGAASLAEFVQKLPISGSAINQTNNSSGNLGFPPDGGGIGAGAAEIDLRYLTSKRVLVLVDGRRWIKGSSGSGVSGAVDLNSIPVNAVKSIEILQDGASAIYGSDAIGGVVNLITRGAAAEPGTDWGAHISGGGNATWGGSASRILVTMSVSAESTATPMMVPMNSGDQYCRPR